MAHRCDTAGEYQGGTMVTKKIGRDAGTGKFMSVADAQKNKKNAVVETIKVKTPPPPPPKKK
jgi:hypothetical protein